MMRSRPGIGLWIAMSVLLIAMVVVFALLLQGPVRKPHPAAESASAAATPTAPSATPSSSSPAALEGAAHSSPVAAFAAIYADAGLEEGEWLRQMSPYVSPTLLASLAGSDRELAAAAGSTLLEQTRSAATVGKNGAPAYSLELAPALSGEEDADPAALPVQIISITFLDAPASRALPLAKNALAGMETTAQLAAVAVLAQPGGESEEQRRTRIRETFADPQAALQTPRPGPAETSIRIGTLRDLTFIATDDGQLALVALVPYAPDGEPVAQWAPLTITLTRGPAGEWIPKDASVS